MGGGYVLDNRQSEAGDRFAALARLFDGSTFRYLLRYGRTLPRRLRAAGLTGVAADAYFPITGPACAALERDGGADPGAAADGHRVGRKP